MRNFGLRVACSDGQNPRTHRLSFFIHSRLFRIDLPRSSCMKFYLVELLTLPAPLLVAIFALFRRDSSRRRADLLTVFIFFAYAPLAEIVLQSLVVHRTAVDPSLLAVDRALHFPTMAIWQWAHAHHAAFVAAAIIYLALPQVVALAWLAEQNTAMRTAWVLTGLLCFVGFALFPAVGPAHYDWSAHSAMVAPRNCLPSMHLSWALLIAIMARRRILKIVFWIFVALTAFATIAIGEHYLIDLIVAVPFTYALRSSAEWLHRQRIYSRKIARPVPQGAAEP